MDDGYNMALLLGIMVLLLISSGIGIHEYVQEDDSKRNKASLGVLIGTCVVATAGTAWYLKRNLSHHKEALITKPLQHHMNDMQKLYQ